MGWRAGWQAAFFSLVNSRSFNWGVAPVDVSFPTSHFSHAAGGGEKAGRGDVGTQPQAHSSWGDAERLVGGVPLGLSAPMDLALQIPPKQDWWWEEVMVSKPDRASQGRDNHLLSGCLAVVQAPSTAIAIRLVMVCGLHTFPYPSARTAESTACSKAPRECSQGLEGTGPPGTEESRLRPPPGGPCSRKVGRHGVSSVACEIRAASFHPCECTQGVSCPRTLSYSSPQPEIIVLPLEAAVKVKWKDACQAIAVAFGRGPQRNRGSGVSGPPGGWARCTLETACQLPLFP